MIILYFIIFFNRGSISTWWQLSLYHCRRCRWKMCSRTWSRPFSPVTADHYAKMRPSRSKHGAAVNPIRTILWIMWLLPTSNSIPNLFVFSACHPKWQIGGALFSSSLWDGLIGLLHPPPPPALRRENACWWFGAWVRSCKTACFFFFFWTGVFVVGVCSVSLCLFESVTVSAGHHPPVSTDPPPPNSASELPCCSLDAVNVLSPFYLFLNIPDSGTPSGRHVTCHMATILIFYLHYDFKIHWKAITHFHGCTTV